MVLDRIYTYLVNFYMLFRRPRSNSPVAVHRSPSVRFSRSQTSPPYSLYSPTACRLHQAWPLVTNSSRIRFLAPSVPAHPCAGEEYACSRANPFRIRFYAEPRSNSFIYRIYAFPPGVRGAVPKFLRSASRHSPLATRYFPFVFKHLPPLTALFETKDVSPPFAFNSLQPLFAKTGGWGYPDVTAIGQLPSRTEQARSKNATSLLLLCLFLAVLSRSLCLLATRANPVYLSAALPPAELHLLSQCGVLKRPGTYRLQVDVSSPGTCFSIQANDVVLNLNGKTITYGTDVRNIPVYGILGVACWDPDFGVGNPCGDPSDHLTVFGGTITQSAGVAPFSHGIRLGQGPKFGPKVYDVTFNVSANSSIPIYTTYVGTGAAIYNNTIKNLVTQIQNRHQLQGQSIKLADTSHIRGPASIVNNHIEGGAQGGIFAAVPNTSVHGNFVKQNGTYTNDFGIYAWSSGGEVYDNVVTPISGRGIQIAASEGERVHNNKVVVLERKANQEYEGCQSGGTFGIQFDDNPKRAEAFQNDVIAQADQCGAQALRVTESLQGSGNVSHDNRYAAERVGNSEAFATGFGSGGAREFTSEHDFFSGDGSAVRFDWDGGTNIVFRNCVFAKGTNPAPKYATFSFRNGGSVRVTNIHFIDSVFQKGAAKDDTDMAPILSAGDWPGPAEYFIDWTVRLSAVNQRNELVAGLAMEIENALGQRVFRGITDHDGRISATLTELKVFNSASQIIKENHSPYSVQVHKEGCRPNPDREQVMFNLTEPTSVSISLNCLP